MIKWWIISFLIGLIIPFIRELVIELIIVILLEWIAYPKIINIIKYNRNKLIENRIEINN